MPKPPFRQPNDDDEVIMRRYGNKVEVTIVSRQREPPIGKYARVAGNKIKNTKTGEVKEMEHHKYRSSKETFKQLKQGSRLTIHNLQGNKSELKLEMKFHQPMPDTKLARKYSQNFLEAIARRTPPLDFIRLLLYKWENEPIYYLFIKTVNRFSIADRF